MDKYKRGGPFYQYRRGGEDHSKGLKKAWKAVKTYFKPITKDLTNIKKAFKGR